MQEAYRRSLVGADLGRLISMTDGVFGFAITFLIVNLVIPISCESANSENCLISFVHGDLNAFVAYVLSFFVIAVWWVRHHGLFKFFARYNAALLWANMVFLLTIAITPFVLGLLADFFGVQVAVILFGLVEASAGFMLIVVWEIGAKGNLLIPEATPSVVTAFRNGMFLDPIIFLVSAAVAVVSVYGAHFVWLALLVEIAYSQIARTEFRFPGKPEPAAAANGDG